MSIITPEYFRHEDLYISASLQAIVDGKQYDLTGRRYFNADLYGPEGTEVHTSKHIAQSIGFGITDISIDVSTSLQPIIEITFKDLYGNTMFGGNNSQGIDYSVFFAWPPPKFKFTFKGYLGRQVTYMLSMKKYDISFNSDDASYSIKGVFVPHQWGFFADLPFSFILAANALKVMDGTIDPDNPNPDLAAAPEYSSSIQELMEIGNEVEITTNQVTETFDNLVTALGDLKSNATAYATNKGSAAFSILSGSVDGEQVQGFKTIQLDREAVEKVDEEDLKGSLTGSLEFVLSKVLIDSKKGRFFDRDITDFQGDDIIASEDATDVQENNIISRDEKKEIRDRVYSVINANLEEIQKEISAKRYARTYGKLNALTISRVLNQIASDSAYVMGRILEAGIKGYSEFKLTRKAAVEQDNLIARHYPLLITEEGEEVPAKGIFGIEEAGNELDFVRTFTAAITQGILEFQNIANIDTTAVNENVAHPISVLELFAPKPYNGSSYTSFAKDILGRSAIAAWFTKNDVITDPGDADEDRIDALTDKDIQNISASDIRRLPNSGSDLHKQQLKNFCTFWTRLLTPKGTGFKLPNGALDKNVFDLEDFLKTDSEDAVDSVILNYEVVIEHNGQTTEIEKITTQEELKTFVAGINDDKKRPVTMSVKEALEGLFTGDLASIDQASMAGNHFINNGVPYFTGVHKKERDFRTFWLAYEGEDAIRAKEVLIGQGYEAGDNNDASATNENFYYIEEALGEDGEDLTEAVELFNKIISKDIVFDYQKIRSNDSSTELNDNLGNFQTNTWINSFASTEDYKEAFLFRRKIKNPNVPEDNTGGVEVSSQNPILFVKAFYLNDNAYKNSDEILDGIIADATADVVQGYAQIVTGIFQVGANLFQGGLNLVTSIFSEDSSSTLVSDAAAAIISPAVEISNSAAAADFVELNERISFDLFTGKRNSAVNNGAIEGTYQRRYIYKVCSKILELIQEIETEDNNVITQILGNAQEGENIIYKQFHSLFQQWNSIVFRDDVDSGGNITNTIAPGHSQLAVELMKEYGSCGLGTLGRGLNTTDVNYAATASASDTVSSRSGVFVYDFPLQRIKQANSTANNQFIQVENALINTDALSEARSDTTVLNVIQAICSKNNFMFIPIPGYANYLDVNDIYTPKNYDGAQRVINFFHVMFIPTPESRALKPSDTYTTPAALSRSQEDLDVDALEVKYGSTENNIVKNIQVSTQDNKVTAESVINLERLVNNENSNKRVTTDCSMLNVMAGRSYTSTIDVLGNAQIFPMQFFFLRNLPMFDGLYQILSVKHSITPNNFETTMEGMRMRFYLENDYGGIFPITIETLAKTAEDRGVELEYLKPEGDNLTAPQSEYTGDADIIPISELPGNKIKYFPVYTNKSRFWTAITPEELANKIKSSVTANLDIKTAILFTALKEQYNGEVIGGFNYNHFGIMADIGRWGNSELINGSILSSEGKGGQGVRTTKYRAFASFESDEKGLLFMAKTITSKTKKPRTAQLENGKSVSFKGPITRDNIMDYYILKWLSPALTSVEQILVTDRATNILRYQKLWDKAQGLLN